ncbi:asparagine synthase (glutamine-hydrolyzing) [Duganella sp. 1224]|uniref:asparagine synthetase B family protein n=1 Tax=Duganella sp. 1224 TaxID=2587052 RepID=UPI0015C95CB7|nr:asparagine synthase C-terminal domain-containing protein [Duganella sp. 1224]NYE60118.1 asparagine synthase (glutamine-hydrolyzing) [Duganella sp. 1224]
MSGLCGYLNLAGAAQPDDAAAGHARAGGTSLAKRCNALARLDTSPVRLLTGELCGLGVAAVAGVVSVHQEPGLLAAVLGRARLDGSGDALARRLVEKWRTRGPLACAELSGHFSVCIVDASTGTVMLAVDRSGVHAMHYQSDPHGLRFATSAEGMPHGELDAQSLFNYLYFHMIPAPRSVYRNQHRLLPGEYLLYRHGRMERGVYWRMRFREERSTPFVAMKGQFLGALREAVRLAADGTERVGAFLSGGTDSSTLAGLLARPTPTYSIGFDVDGYDEMAYARIAAQHFQTDHHEYYLTAGDVADAIPRIAAASAQPFGNASVVPAYFCAQMARADGVTRLLGGDGGDELFGGNERYARQAIFARYEQLPSALRQVLLEPVLFGLAGRWQAPLLRKARSYVEQALVPMPARLETYNLLQRYGPAQVLDAGFLASVDEAAPLAQLHACYWESHGLSQINRMQALDLRYTLADNDLRKVTLACELAGVEAAFPFLSDEMLAFSAVLPPRDKLNGTRLRYFFKHALREHLPPAILRKKKHGFGMPFGHWLVTDARLRELAFDSLASLKPRRIVRADFIDRLTTTLVLEHPAYHGTMVWVLMMLEQWLQQHTTPPRVAAPTDAAEIAAGPAPMA